MRRLLILLGLSAILAIALVVYGVTDWPAAAWASLVATLVLLFVGIAFRFVWTGDDFDDIDIDV